MKKYKALVHSCQCKAHKSLAKCLGISERTLKGKLKRAKAAAALAAMPKKAQSKGTLKQHNAMQKATKNRKVRDGPGKPPGRRKTS